MIWNTSLTSSLYGPWHMSSATYLYGDFTDICTLSDCKE